MKGLKESSDTYIPVQPNLQPKPWAERTSGRKKESTNVKEVSIENEKVHSNIVSLKRTCRKKKKGESKLRLNGKDAS